MAVEPAIAIAMDQVDVVLSGHTILRALDFSIARGAFVGVIGPNGAGKTTLIRLILGLIRPSAGTIRVLGMPVGKGRRRIGYVPQSFAADPDLPLRAKDLVGLGLDGERWGFTLPSRSRQQRIQEMLDRVGASAYANEPVGTLSGGERQRLLIAQALLTNPDILLLDEPLSNLDIRSGREIIELVDEIARERQVTVLFVAHDMNPLLAVMNEVLYLAQGRAVVGSVDDVVQPEVLSRLYGQPVDVLRVHGRILVIASDSVVPLTHFEGVAHGQPSSPHL